MMYRSSLRSDAAERSLVAAPVQGFRRWTVVRQERAGEIERWLLAGIGMGGEWEARDHGESRATCLAHTARMRLLPMHPHDDAPDASCTCGFYLLKDGPVPGGPVAGSAEGWGRIVEHAAGWRCEFARPTRLRIDRRHFADIHPHANVSSVADQLRERYRCDVELVDESRPSTLQTVVVASLLGVCLAAPFLAGSTSTLHLLGAAILIATAMFVALLGALGRRVPS
jgi:hypothetical protein